jgi:SAM-dependent methyltransferase
MPLAFQFACPVCRSPLEPDSPNLLRCPNDQRDYPCIDGIWRMLPPERQAYYRQFVQDYESVRQAEGRGSRDPNYYRSLPFKDTTGDRTGDWNIRSRSYQSFIKHCLTPWRISSAPNVTALDLGAGNGWLSYRLAQIGFQVAAIDLLTNPTDGLGTHIHYEADFTPVQSEYDSLPFTGQQFDLVVFNASFHYSTDYAETLREALRVLRSEGKLVILDSPVYRNAASGAAMVREREALFRQKYGFASNALPSENYLTRARLDQLASELGLSWDVLSPWYGLRWALRPLKARLAGRREPAQFLILTTEKQ